MRGEWKAYIPGCGGQAQVSRVILLVHDTSHGGISALNFLAMRLGPGKHLKGLTLMDGIVKAEEFDYFHEVLLPPFMHRSYRHSMLLR